MALDSDETPDLFRTFMPRRKEILHRSNEQVIDLKIYPPDYFKRIFISTPFLKWAVVEVDIFEKIPQGMERVDFLGGLYAMFQVPGTQANHQVFTDIFSHWLPSSGFELDDRPHFDVLNFGENNNFQEIYIPLTQK